MTFARHHQQQQAQDSMEKELSASSGLTLGESPQHGGSPRRSLFRRSATPDDKRPTRHLHGTSSTANGRPLVLPHTITERHGGQELWVRAPVVSGSLEKRGFRWRKKWKLRFVELDGRQLAYYEDTGAFCATTASCNGTKRSCKPKRKVMLTADATLEDVDDKTVSVTPALDEKPWMLRARDAATKQRWLVALSDCIDILVWLRHYKLGAVLGVGGNGVVQKLEDERDGTMFAVKDRITVEEILAHPWIVREEADKDGGRSEERDLTASMMSKLQCFNIDRKSQNMGSFMASMLLDDNEADFQALVDEETIEMMIRQLCVDGHSRIPLQGAHVIAKGLGLSPYIDEKSFVRFLDQNQDGFIDASDFCNGVRAMRDHHHSFATMVFSALLKMNSLEEKSDSDEEVAETHALAREHFAVAFKKLECPEPLVEVFLKYIDDEEEKQQSARDSGDDSSASTSSSWSVNEAKFATLFTQFSFLGMLFLRKAHENVVSMVKSYSIDDMPRISEGSFSSS
ncbi:hypothetical protein PRNP1_013687 [Phytophthora ramorum]